MEKGASLLDASIPHGEMLNRSQAGRKNEADGDGSIGLLAGGRVPSLMSAYGVSFSRLLSVH